MQPMALLQNITPGTITQVQVGPCAQVAVDNDSPYDAWISFAAQPPLSTPQPTTLQQWDGVARSQATSYLTVPDQTPGFNGVIYLGIYNPAGLILPGTISSRANIYVSALQAGETPGAVFAVPRITDVSSQPRAISVPISPTLFYSSSIAATTQTVVTQNIFQTQPLGAQGKLTYYLFAVAFSVFVLGSTGTGIVAFDVKVQDANGSGNVGPQQSMFHVVVTSLQPFGLAFPCPLSAVRPGVGNVGVTQSTLQLVMQPAIIPTSSTLFIHFSVCFDMDSANDEAVPSVGGGYGVSPLEATSTNLF